MMEKAEDKMMKLFFKMVLCVWLLTAAFVSESIADEKGYRSPQSVAGTESVSVADAKKLFDEGVVFVDVRNSRYYAKGHIPGAVHLDYKHNYDEDNLLSAVKKHQPLVIYCSGVKCSRSHHASEKAVSWGFTEVKYFRGGIVDWRKAAYPTDSGGK